VGVAALSLGAVAASFAETVTVDAIVGGGSRTLTLKTLSGSNLDALALGAAGSAPFVANVTDARYSRAGYQINATLSDMYLVSGSGFDCSTKIPSGSFSLGFLVNPISVSDVKAVVQPVWDLSGSLTGTLATLLGVGAGTPVTVSNLEGEQLDERLDGAFSGTEDALPVKVAKGTAGAFSAPAPHASCAATPGGTPTTRSIMDGSKSDLSALYTWVGNSVTDEADANSDGAITANELVSNGAVSDGAMSAAVRDALATAGVNLTTLDTLVAGGTVSMSQIYATLTATLDPVASLVGQTGSYTATPKLDLSIPSGAGPGTYRGTMTVTLVDTP
jgi:hypothetical protein